MMYRLMLVFVLATAPALAQTGPDPAGGTILRSIGTWSDWEAFTAAGTTDCLMLSYPFSAVPSVEGQGEPALTVTRRPGRQDTVSLAAGSADIGSTRAELRVGAEAFPLDTGPDGAFVRDAAAAGAAMKRGLQVVANFVGPQGARATVTYSLRGFRAAYGATRRVCPER